MAVAVAVPTGFVDGIGSAHTFDDCVNTEYDTARPPGCAETVCALRPVVRRTGSPTSVPVSETSTTNRSRLPSRSETMMSRRGPSHAGLVLRWLPPATCTAGPPADGRSHTLLGARFPTLMKPTSMVDAPAP